MLVHSLLCQGTATFNQLKLTRSSTKNKNKTTFHLKNSGKSFHRLLINVFRVFSYTATF